MDNRTLGIIGGVALFLALISPFFMENSNKVKELYKRGEKLRQDNEYMNAVDKYSAALKESKKLGKTPKNIDSDFPSLPISIITNYRIALCYYEIGKALNDNGKYIKARTYIDKTINTRSNNQLSWNLKFLQAMILYRTDNSYKALDELKKLEDYSPRNDQDSQRLSEVIFAIGDIYLQQAKKLHEEVKPEEEKRKKCEEAKNYFQKVVDNFPNSNYFVQAENGINKIKEIYSERPEPDPPPIEEREAKMILDQANRFKENQDFIRAMQHYDKLIEVYPESKYITFAYEGKGDIYSEKGNYIQALGNYEEAIEIAMVDERKILLLDKYHSVFPKPKPIKLDNNSNNDEIEFIRSEAIRLRNLLNYYEAAELFYRLFTLIQTDYDKSKYFRQTSQCYYEAYLKDKRMFERTVKALKTLSDENQESIFSIHADYYLVKIYIDELKYDLVIDTINKVNNLYRNQQDEVIVDILKQLMDKKTWAETNLRRTPEHIPNGGQPTPIPDPDYVVLINRAEQHLKNNEFDEAKIYVDKALDINPEYVPAKLLINSIRTGYITKGNKFFVENQYSNAIDEYKKSLEVDSNFAEAYCNIGVSYIYLNNYQQAIDELKKSIQNKPDFKEAYLYLAYAYYRYGSREQAFNTIKEALRLDPNYIDAQILKRTLEKGY